MNEQPTTSGVQELIDRLSQEGVAEGQQRAESIVADARAKASNIIESARVEANRLLKDAREEAEQFQMAAEDALRLAARDAVRDFSARIHDGLRHRLQELVQHQMKDADVLKRMILAITNKATEGLDDEQLEILLPAESLGEDEIRTSIESGNPDALTEYMQGVIGERIREGAQVRFGSRANAGLTVRVVRQNVEIDLTDEAITELLARHLLPRYRAIMR